MPCQIDRLSGQKWKDVRNNLWEQWKCISESHPMVLWVNQKMTNDDIVTDFMPLDEDFALTGPVGHCQHSIPLVQYQIEFVAENFVCWTPWISDIQRFSAPSLAFKNKFLDLCSWLTCENSWATKIVSYWSTLLFWERCANHDIKPGELFNFLQLESCFGFS